MSYRSEKKLSRQGFDGNYRRTSPQSPEMKLDMENNASIWEQRHNIRQHGTTLIFHSDSIRKSPLDESINNMKNSQHYIQETADNINIPMPFDMLNNKQISIDNSLKSMVNDKSTECDLQDRGKEQIPVTTSQMNASPLGSGSNGTGPLQAHCNPDSRSIEAETVKQNVPLTNGQHQHTVYTSQEDRECDRLFRDFLDQCRDLSLRNLFVSTYNTKTIIDYMDGLLDVQPRRSFTPPRIITTANVLPQESLRFSSSESASNSLLEAKKEELILSINKKIARLQVEYSAIKEEIKQNDLLGRDVCQRVERSNATSNEIDKFRLHLEESEKIVSLLLSVSGRLARAQNTLQNLEQDVGDQEKRFLEGKRDKLKEQHLDARRLKERIDKRATQISKFLLRYLSDLEFAEYDHFSKTKCRLLLESREVDEKIKSSQEQVAALRTCLNLQLWRTDKS